MTIHDRICKAASNTKEDLEKAIQELASRENQDRLRGAVHRTSSAIADATKAEFNPLRAALYGAGGGAIIGAGVGEPGKRGESAVRGAAAGSGVTLGGHYGAELGKNLSKGDPNGELIGRLAGAILGSIAAGKLAGSVGSALNKN